MKMIDLGQTISILANMGVIAGIVFLGYELRQNNRFLAEQTRYSMLQNQIGWVDSIASNAESARLVFLPNDEPALTELQKIQRVEILMGLLRRWEWEYQRSELGIGDLPPLAAFQTGFRRVHMGQDWAELRLQLSPEFAEWMQANVAGKE